jgi:hypothetical protein
MQQNADFTVFFTAGRREGKRVEIPAEKATIIARYEIRTTRHEVMIVGAMRTQSNLQGEI